MSATESAGLVIIGAGPAGMAAAITSANHGNRVVLLDEQPSPGGQIYRNINRSTVRRDKILGADYLHGRTLTENLDKPQISYRPNAKVWRVDDDGQICYSVGARATRLTAKQIIIATGALERPVPLPGWTLPGVMSAGAAQILLKSSGLVPANTVLGRCCKRGWGCWQKFDTPAYAATTPPSASKSSATTQLPAYNSSRLASNTRSIAIACYCIRVSCRTHRSVDR